MDERTLIENTIREYPFLSMKEIAAKLGLTKRTLYHRMKDYSIIPKRSAGRKRIPVKLS